MAVCTMYEYLYPSTPADWPSPGKNSLASPASKKAQHTSMTPLSLNGMYKYKQLFQEQGRPFSLPHLLFFCRPRWSRGWAAVGLGGPVRGHDAKCHSRAGASIRYLLLIFGGGTCARTSDFAGAVSLCLHSWALVTRHIFGDSLHCSPAESVQFWM